jgi:hypothetical protein
MFRPACAKVRAVIENESRLDRISLHANAASCTLTIIDA